MRMLQNQGLVPIEIGEVSARGGSRGVGKATEQGKRLAIRELATLLAAGVPVGEAVESLAQAHEATQIGEAFSRVQTALRDGRRFSVAVSESGLGLPPYVVQLSSAAELAGKLAEAL